MWWHIITYECIHFYIFSNLLLFCNSIFIVMCCGCFHFIWRKIIFALVSICFGLNTGKKRKHTPMHQWHTQTNKHAGMPLVIVITDHLWSEWCLINRWLVATEWRYLSHLCSGSVTLWLLWMKCFFSWSDSSARMQNRVTACLNRAWYFCAGRPQSQSVGRQSRINLNSSLQLEHWQVLQSCAHFLKLT